MNEIRTIENREREKEFGLICEPIYSNFFLFFHGPPAKLKLRFCLFVTYFSRGFWRTRRRVRVMIDLFTISVDLVSWFFGSLSSLVASSPYTYTVPTNRADQASKSTQKEQRPRKERPRKKTYNAFQGRKEGKKGGGNE